MSIFSSVPITKLSRSTFNLDHENKLSFNFGGLYPILCQTEHRETSYHQEEQSDKE